MPKAHGIVDQLSAIGAAIEEEALSVLSSAERTLLRESLSRMREGLDKLDREDKGVRAVSGGVE
jgi:DNA-binding MarR family transcriptional regulator